MQFSPWVLVKAHDPMVSFTCEFYRTYWETLSPSLHHVFNWFHEYAHIPLTWTKTFLTFIPKTKNPTTVNHYRPIALSNVNLGF